MKWPARTVIENGIKKKTRSRLLTLPPSEIIRWADTTTVAVGVNVNEIRKSLAHNDVDQAKAFMEEAEKGAWSILAAMQALKQLTTESYKPGT